MTDDCVVGRVMKVNMRRSYGELYGFSGIEEPQKQKGTVLLNKYIQQLYSNINSIYITTTHIVHYVHTDFKCTESYIGAI